ncbi:AmmeMemoRadiSam system protein B [Candidatus Woesearchaeota archaeon]|nr:AmmeMemoRadiSam system protein B [Candidatus Woesearchaeota archaeon]
MDREPIVAGRFYEDDPKRLAEEVAGCFTHPRGPGALPGRRGRGGIRAVIAPHAGFMFSGPAAAHCYKQIGEATAPDVFVMLGPNHTGMGRTGICLQDFLTPLGRVKVDRELSRELIAGSPLVEDLHAHQFEHSLEVQLPFLQTVMKDRSDTLRIVPIVVSSGYRLDAIASHIASALERSGKTATLIVSSDFTHYGPSYGYEPFGRGAKGRMEAQDRQAIGRILALDDAGFMGMVDETGMTVCGYLPITVLLKVLKAQGKAAGECLCYYTSGDIIGDRENMVGYASIVFR